MAIEYRSAHSSVRQGPLFFGREVPSRAHDVVSHEEVNQSAPYHWNLLSDAGTHRDAAVNLLGDVYVLDETGRFCFFFKRSIDVIRCLYRLVSCTMEKLQPERESELFNCE